MLREHLPGVEVWAYGSRANGLSHDGSDLDLVLRGHGLTEIDASRLGEFTDALRESTIPFLVETRDWARLPESFHREIEREHVVLVAADQNDGPKRKPRGSMRTLPPTSRSLGIASEWRKYDVSALIHDEALVIGDGYRARNAELSNAGLPFARAGNIRNGFQFSDAECFPEDELHKVGEKISQPGDTVFTSKGTVGRFAFVKKDTPRFVYSPQLCYWRSLNTEIIEPRFLYYWMASREFFSQFKSVAGQTDMAEYVSLGDQRRMHITVPPLLEQRAIAHILGTLDDKIELNRRMNETLEAMARALFKSWFVDFDPVRAKMEGHDTGLPQDIADLFPDRLVPSELGEIPEGWEVKTLRECMNLTMGQSPPGSTYKEHGEGVIRLGNSGAGLTLVSVILRIGSSVPLQPALPSPGIPSLVCSARRRGHQHGLGKRLHRSRRGGAETQVRFGVIQLLFHLDDSGSYSENTSIQGQMFGAINKSQFEAFRVIEPHFSHR